MIQIGDVFFTDFDKLNEALLESQVQFSFWEGRRFYTKNGLNAKLNDIIEVVNKHLQRPNPPNANPIINTIRKMEIRGYVRTTNLQDEYIEDKNLFIRVFTNIKHWFGEKWRERALAELDVLNSSHFRNNSKNVVAPSLQPPEHPHLEKENLPKTNQEDNPSNSSMTQEEKLQEKPTDLENEDTPNEKLKEQEESTSQEEKLKENESQNLISSPRLNSEEPQEINFNNLTLSSFPAKLKTPETKLLVTKKISFLESSDFKPDVPILQYFLADFVGGGKGNRLNAAVFFFKHYLERYCETFSDDLAAKKIQATLSYYYEVPLNESLQAVTQELFKRLTVDKYVAFSGGRYDSDGGHAMFYELYLDLQNNVIFKVTNSGEGLEYHPKYEQKFNNDLLRDYRYRTLVFSGITFDKLKEDFYIETILSFDRPRAPAQELKGLVNFPQGTYTNINDLYQFLFYTWRGSRSIKAENPGGPQRANSCSVYALMKWIKGNYDPNSPSQNSHLFMNFWIKAAALSDYLNNEKLPCSAFISDSLRKLSSQASKIEALKVNVNSWLKAWIELSKEAKKIAIQAQERESEELLKQSIHFPDEGIDLSQVTPIGIKEASDQDKKVQPAVKFNYVHKFAGEKPDYKLLPDLSLSYRASLMEESAQRLNFFRVLPDFNTFAFENDVLSSLQDTFYERTQFFSDLAVATKKFFYTSEAFDSIHIPDSFFSDLLNAWMITYLEAKRQNIIPPEVLLEWIEGVTLLTEAYSSEYSFDIPKARDRFKSVDEYCKQEKKELLEKLGPSYKSPTVKYWEIHDHPLEKEMVWDPFGAYWNDSKNKPQKMEELPESARFAFRHMNDLVLEESLISKKPLKERTAKEKIIQRAALVNKWYSNNSQTPDDVIKGIAMFGGGLPLIPLFDSLRESLACLYLFADRYLDKSHSLSKKESHTSILQVNPSQLFERSTLSSHKPTMGSKAWVYSRRPSVTNKPSEDPEYYLPLAEQKNEDLIDFNQRIQMTFAKKSEDLPFFAEDEQKEFVAFVQKNLSTRLPEYLSFCKKNLVQLALPTYQKTFEHVFFSLTGWQYFDKLFKNLNDPLNQASFDLLLNFISNGIKEIVTKNRKNVRGAAFLLQMEFRLYSLLIHYNYSEEKIHTYKLFADWGLLIQEAKNNPILAKALGAAISKAMPVIESAPAVYKDSQFLPFLACTWLLECCQEASVKFSCDEITLVYAYQASINLIAKSERAEEIWKAAAQEVLKSEISSCHWDREKGTLEVNKLVIDLAAREIQKSDDSLSQQLPKKLMEGNFVEFFGKIRPLCKKRKENNFAIYSFRYKQIDYEIHYNEGTESEEIYRKIAQSYYKLSSKELDVNYNHWFKYATRLWEDGKSNKIFLENKDSRKIFAVLQENGEITRLKNGKISKNILSQFNGNDTLLKSLVERIEAPNLIVVWCNNETKLISHIEMLGLETTLVVSMNGKKTVLSCPLYPGFYVAQSQYVDFLKNYESYLVLENVKGQKKVLVSVQNIDQKYEPYSLQSIKVNSGSFGLIAYDLDIDEEEPELTPAPAQTRAVIMLLFIYVSTKQYQKALDLIQKTSLTSKKCKDEISLYIIEWIIKNDSKEKLNVHPYAVALRMHIYWWQPVLSKKLFSKIEKDFLLYHDLYHSLNKYALPQEKIQEIQKNLNITKLLRGPQKLDSILRFDTLGWNSKGVWALRDKIAVQSAQKPTYPSSFASLGEDFILNFLPYYKIAKDGASSEKLILKRLLLSANRERDFSTFVVLRTLLVFALTTPSRAPSVAEIEKLFKSSMAENEFITQIENIGNHVKEALLSINASVSYWLSEKNSPTIQEEGEKRVIHPSARRIDIPFQSLSLVKIPEPLKTYSIDKIENEILEKKALSLTHEKEAENKLYKWGKERAATFKEKPVIQAQFERIAEGAKLYREDLDNKNLSSQELIQDLQKINETWENYEIAIENSKKESESLKNEIIEMANDTSEDIGLSFEYLRDLRSSMDMEYLLIALGRGDKSAIKNGNPSLSEEKINDLMTKTGTYALMLTEQQKLVRSQTKLNNYRTLIKEGRTEELAQASLEYVETRNAIRVFNPSEYPNYLVFEALADLLIKQEQWEALQNLTNPTQAWTLFEARTGFGKSKVLMPLWLILTCDAKHLTMAIAPATLFDQSNDYLQKLLQRGYGFFGERIDFDRDSECSQQDIQEIEETLRLAKENRRPIFMSDQTAHQLFVLKVKELAAQKTSVDSYATLEALLKLRSYVKENGVLFIDEPHKVLDDSQESNYSIGNPTHLEEWRLLFSLQLFESLFSLLKGKYRVEFCQEGKELPLLTEEAYQKEILPGLLDTFLETKKVVIEDKQALSYLKGELNQEEQEAFEKKLTESENLENAKLRILHDQLHHYLPQTLKKNSGEHYTLVDEMGERNAIPLEDARNPKKGNEFCSADQIINFTIQANLKTLFSYDYMAHYFETLSLQAAAEMGAGKEGIKETIAYKKFLLVTGKMKSQPKSLLKISPEEIEAIYTHVNNDPFSRLQFIGLAVLPNLRRYNEKITSSPHLLMQCFKTSYGASGTLSMQNFPSKFQIIDDKKAIAKTLVSLLKKGENQIVVEMEEKGSQRIVAALSKIIGKASVFIEIGAVLRDYSTLLQIAKDFLYTLSDFEAVATFDQNGHVVVLKKGEKRFVPKDFIDIKAEKIFWIYGQKDITGTDEKLPPLAEALVFINEHTNLTELIQGVGRMRGIHAGQSVRICIDPDTALHIRKALGISVDTLSYLDILEYCARKEGENNGDANFQSLSLQWNAILEAPFWENASKQNGEAVSKTFNFLRSLLVESTKDEPLHRLSLSKEPLPINKAMEKLDQRYKNRIEKTQTLLNNSNPILAKQYDRKSLLTEMSNIKNKMQYPDKVFFNDDANLTQIAIASATQVNNAQEQMLLNITMQEQGEKVIIEETTSTQTMSTWSAKNGNRKWLPHQKEMNVHTISSILHRPKLETFTPLFSGLDLWISENSFITLTGDSLEIPGWLNGYVKPLHYLLFHDEQSIIIDAEEAAQTIEKRTNEVTLWLINHGVVYSTKNDTTEEMLKKDSIRQLELATKILDGDLEFNELQWKDLTNWISGHKKLLLEEFIDSIICDVRPGLNKTSHYFRFKNWISID
jgi:hypothetical protein